MKKLLRIVRDVPAHWVGDGFPVQTLFSYGGDTAAIDPFLLLDYAAPYDFAPCTAPRGVGEHPHRGFETVTIVYQGELAHRDSGGNQGTIGPGDVQWMTAAAGVVHEEFHSTAFTAAGGTFEVAQLWVNLPAKDKLSPPRYQEIRAGDIPRVTLSDGLSTARVIAGEFGAVRGPARTFTPIQLWDMRLAARAAVELPVANGHTALLLVRRGSVKVNGDAAIGAGELALFDRTGDGISLKSDAEAAVLLLAGEPIGEPVAGRGPFVMNTEAELRQAMIDYQSGRMGSL
jgi:redox-sensitive bicupin YhaK (pirin superfamily)